jgi:hypothetical protein
MVVNVAPNGILPQRSQTAVRYHTAHNAANKSGTTASNQHLPSFLKACHNDATVVRAR